MQKKPSERTAGHWGQAPARVPSPWRLVCLYTRHLTISGGGRAGRLGVARNTVHTLSCKGRSMETVENHLSQLACIQFPDALLHLLEGPVDVFYEILSNPVWGISQTVH